jgi:hypothetical protein
MKCTTISNLDYLFVKTVNVVEHHSLEAQLSQNCAVEVTIKRNPLEEPFANDKTEG